MAHCRSSALFITSFFTLVALSAASFGQNDGPSSSPPADLSESKDLTPNELIRLDKALVGGDAGGATKPTTAAQAKAAFDAKFNEYKAVLREVEQLRSQYQTADAANRKKLNEQLTGHLAHAQSLINGVVDAAMEAYRLAPNADPQITGLLIAVAEHYAIGRDAEGQMGHPSGTTFGGDQYEKALPIINLLREGGADKGELPVWGFLSAFATNNYELAEQYLNKAIENRAFQQTAGPVDPARKRAKEAAMGYAQVLDQYRTLWARESEVREKEAAADDLPRVKLTTTKGEITLELFENEAPQSVANFLTLVKQGFYDGSPFHRVLPGFMAQGGAKTEDGEGGPGYTIRCECQEPDARMHFRGSLSMAHRGPDTGSSQFFLTFVPTTHLDGKHTVFGRVIDGMAVLGDLTRRNPQDPPPHPTADRIIKAEVLRDRGHEYSFERLPESGG